MANRKKTGDRFPPLDGRTSAVVAAARDLAALYRGEDYLHVCVAGDGHYLDVFDSAGDLRYTEQDGRRVR